MELKSFRGRSFKMARHFQSSASEYLSIASAVITAAPITMACWFYSYETNPADDFYLMDVHSSGATRFQNSFSLILGADFPGPGVDKIRAGTADVSSFATGDSTLEWTPLTWQHACGVWASAASRSCFLNGGFKGTETTSLTPGSLDMTSIGRVGGSAPAAYMWGRVAHAAIWSVALDDAEVSMLAAGALPSRIRRENLVAYWPLTQATPIDLEMVFPLVATGTRMAPDPPLVNPTHTIGIPYPFLNAIAAAADTKLEQWQKHGGMGGLMAQ
jgi:hypothetical protein